ncbi:hypothetical protein A3I51_04905 [Candidatus Gottesmanbacteria bacterium RIFCSPLOWO2_02_FULL_38_8]|nr:MAG: hypothetical protein A3I51_04905 [Candidatus Gottesmanbacteria bacterium RIFCSPLOWO2_02_FULL_38_8]
MLPFDIAYNLPMVIFGSLGVLVQYFFLLEAFNFPIALLGSLILALNPTYIGYLHNNMKDIPNAFAFALSIWLFWRLVKFRNVSSLLFASLAFAFAFNVKINSVFIPVICGLYYLLVIARTPMSNRGAWQSRANARKQVARFLDFARNDRIILLYFVLAPLFALLVWWPFWSDPLGKLMELPKFYSLNTYNMPVLFFGNIIRSGINIPPFYPYIYLAITTPLPILITAIIGIIFSTGFAILKKYNYLLLLLWFFMPLVRYLDPKTGAIDGVRHFMEVLYPFSFFAGVGSLLILRRFNKNYRLIIAFILFTVLLIDNIKFHPYQTSFFNSLIGGVSGANGKFDIDFWGTPQKEAVLWLNNNAPYKSYIHIVMAQSTAASYLRSDLLDNVNKKNITESDYIVLLNRQSFFNLYGISPQRLSKDHQLVFSRKIENVPLVWVFKR